MMNKKAQFYIFVAILLVTYAFAITRPATAPKQTVSAFKSLYENFISESPVVINHALHNSSDVSAVYELFVDDFLQFARTKEPNFRLVYLLVDGDTLVIGNRLKDTINVTANQNPYSLSSGKQLTLDKSDTAELIVNDIRYEFSFDETDVQLKALFRKEDKNEVRIYVYK
jgi:hypothetical protein